MKPVRQLTAAQIALSQARKAEKLLRQQQQAAAQAPVAVLDPRPWLTLPSPPTSTRQVKILSWNLLAQCLIRRELFPNSDCLKVGQREPMIHEEIARQDAHILCLQEVDRLEKLLPMLEKIGYAYQYASGPRKKHGCLIAFKKDLYTLSANKVVFYDDENIPRDSETPRKGNTFKTRNIASLVALRRNDDSGQGLIVATTHLFWHPRYTYERIRQVGIMFQETVSFRQEHSGGQWPCILAGDFNFTPSDAAYSLLLGDTLLPVQEAPIVASQVIHANVDAHVLTNSAPSASAKAASTEEEEDETDPDRVITNARKATPEDGLLTIPEIIAWFAKLPRPRSAYNDGLSIAKEVKMDILTYGVRVQMPPDRHGFNEPEYTSYTFYWKNPLDYIFFLDVEQPATVTGLAKPPTNQDMDPGLPKSRISGSDHTTMVAELTW